LLQGAPTKGNRHMSQVNLDSLSLADLLAKAEVLLARSEDYQRHAEAAEYQTNLSAVVALGQIGAAGRQVEAELARLGLELNPPEPLLTSGLASTPVLALREWLRGPAECGYWPLQPGQPGLGNMSMKLATLREIVKDLRAVIAVPPAADADDPTAFKPQSEFIDEDFPTHKAIKKALDHNRWIRWQRPTGESGKPIPNRRVIHAGDWHAFRRQARAVDPLDSPCEVVDAAIEAAGRQAEIRKLKGEAGK
jgi:hypothetical protein